MDVEREAIEDIGLKPWEFKAMRPREYMLYAQGFYVRRDLEAENFRNLFALIHDVNVRKQDRIMGSPVRLARVWPIPSLDKIKNAILSAEEMKSTFREQLKLSEQYNSLKNAK